MYKTQNSSCVDQHNNTTTHATTHELLPRVSATVRWCAWIVVTDVLVENAYRNGLLLPEPYLIRKNLV